MKVETLDQIIAPLKERKEFFYDNFGVRNMGVFGSFVNGTQTPDSDIDIIIEMDKEKKNLHNILKFKRYLENEFGRVVDLGFEHTLKDIVRENIKDTIAYV